MPLLSWIRLIDVHQNAVFEMGKNRWRARVTENRCNCITASFTFTFTGIFFSLANTHNALFELSLSLWRSLRVKVRVLKGVKIAFKFHAQRPLIHAIVPNLVRGLHSENTVLVETLLENAFHTHSGIPPAMLPSELCTFLDPAPLPHFERF